MTTDNDQRVEYLCTRCGLESHVFIAADADVYSGCQRLKSDHQKWSPNCTGDLSTFRLVPKLETDSK